MLSCRRRRVLVLAVVVRGVMQRCGVGWSRLWLHRGIVASSLPFVPFCRLQLRFTGEVESTCPLGVFISSWFFVQLFRSHRLSLLTAA